MLIKKQTTSAFLFQNLSQLLESRPSVPTLANTKQSIWRNLLSIQNEAISLVAMRSKELWLVQKNHATDKLDSNAFSWNEDLQQKQNLTAKSSNIKENAGKTKSVFVIRAAVWAEKLGWWTLQELKEYVWKTCGCGQRLRLFDSTLNERIVSDGGNLCPLWLVILKSVWHSIGDTL